MGGTPPTPPQVVMPPETKPEYFQSVIPLESFQDAAGYLGRIENRLNQAIQERYRTTGTPAELAARGAGTRLQEVASYRSSLPSSDKFLSDDGSQSSYIPAKGASDKRLTQAEKEYGEALSRIKEPPPEFSFTGTPSWAQRTIAAGMPPGSGAGAAGAAGAGGQGGAGAASAGGAGAASGDSSGEWIYKPGRPGEGGNWYSATPGKGPWWNPTAPVKSSGLLSFADLARKSGLG